MMEPRCGEFFYSIEENESWKYNNFRPRMVHHWTHLLDKQLVCPGGRDREFEAPGSMI